MILSQNEASAALLALREINNTEIGRVELGFHNGARLMFFSGGGTLAVYGTKNRANIAGAAVLQADEDYFSLADFQAAYDLQTTD